LPALNRTAIAEFAAETSGMPLVAIVRCKPPLEVL